jgi:hypothetical protein
MTQCTRAASPGACSSSTVTAKSLVSPEFSWAMICSVLPSLGVSGVPVVTLRICSDRFDRVSRETIRRTFDRSPPRRLILLRWMSTGADHSLSSFTAMTFHQLATSLSRSSYRHRALISTSCERSQCDSERTVTGCTVRVP